MNITIISSSTRAESQSRRVSEYLLQKLMTLSVEASIIDLADTVLPVFNGSREGAEQWPAISSTLEKSDGYIFVSPEWDGMMSVGLHNLIHYTNKEMADKPVVVVGVSSGVGGRYPLAQMRIMGYKNKRFVVIPDSLFFDHVVESLVGGELVEHKHAERTDYVLRVLVEYAKGLHMVRKSGTLDYAAFPNGL